MGQTNSSWGNWIYCQSLQQTQILNSPSPHSLLPWSQLLSWFLSLLPHRGTGGQGMGVAISSSHIVSAASFSSREELTLFPCSRSLLGVQSLRNRLLQRGCSGHKPCQQACSIVGSSLHVGPALLLNMKPQTMQCHSEIFPYFLSELLKDIIYCY